MKNASKMARYMMMRGTRENGDMRSEGRRGDYTRAEYGGGMQNGGHEMESRFRDRRGREHYDNGRYAPQNTYNEGGGMQTEMRTTSGGSYARYGGMRSADDDEEHGMEMRMNTIGFGNRDYPEPVYQQGGAYAEDMKLTPELAKEWTARMKNGDGTTGAHWPMEQVKQLMQQRGINADPAEFFAILNSVYSDYYTVAKKHNVHNIDFYIDIAKAWLDDKDAVPDKAAAYYEYVVKH